MIDTASLVTDALLVMVGVPASILAWQQRRDRGELRENRRITQLIKETMVGDQRQEAAREASGEASGEAMLDIVRRVAHQVQPSNGKTMAHQVEETRREMARVAVLVGEHMSDGHGGQVWPAEPSRR